MTFTIPSRAATITTAIAITLASSASAQIPFDYIVSLERADILMMESSYAVISPLGSGTSRIRDQRVFAPLNSVSIDPVDSSKVFFDNTATSFPGLWEMSLDRTDHVQSLWGPWGSNPTIRHAVGTTEAWYVDLTGLFSVPRAGGMPTLRLAGSFVDLAVLGTKVWLAEAPSTTGATSSVVEFDTTTNSSRPIRPIVGLTCVAAQSSNVLYAGTDSGLIVQIDPTTGATVNLPTPVGAILAIAATSLSLPVFATANDVWSFIDLTTPVYSSPNPILDIDVAKAPGSAVFRFAAGCGRASRTPVWNFSSGLPDTGNLGFALAMESGPAGAAAAILLGGSRTASGSVGPLPFALDPIGMPGCALLVDPAISIPTTLDGMGSASIPVPITSTPPAFGLELFGQWLVVDPPANALGLVTSEGAVLIAR